MKECKLKKALNSTKEKLSKISGVIADGFYNLLHKHDWLIFVVIISVIALGVRLSNFDIISGDLKVCITKWYKVLYDEGFTGLGRVVGDYTPAYNYILYIISLFRLDPESIELIHAVKWVSVVFDYALAIICALFCYKVTKSKPKSILAYGLVLFGITIFLNSSLWGQCDSIYATFAIASLYFVWDKKFNLGFIMYGLSFAFKLQAIFILPVYLVLFLRRELKLKYFLWIIIVYVLLALPASFAAEDFWARFVSVLAVYLNQAANSYKQITLNAGTLYSIIYKNFEEHETMGSFSLFLAMFILGTNIFMIYKSKEKITSKIYFEMIILFAMLFPFVLPHMHDRYFYIVDALIVVYALVNCKRFYVAILAIMNSMIGYMSYLWSIAFIPAYNDTNRSLSFRAGAIMYLISIIIVAIDLYKKLYPHGLKENTLIEE